ncbi:thioesterase [Amycolatopsis antarctica]|uniref:Thioesterase n=2 Tax=Amycolatopsis antarctica TaxID=1854586 RepID=A0A263D2X2_9PSEU|nr:thioesterase family protein [Amycolatopsis antarctica]OZM71705.1 thioesterase [Amycolatopsis antarctica]
MDVFGHVNHANLVTLLEEARVPLLFEESAGAGLGDFAKGLVVVRLDVRYRRQITVAGQDLRVRMSLPQVRNATFTLAYEVHAGPSAEDEVAATAETVLAPFDVARQRPRRLSGAERDFLVERLAAGKVPVDG